MLLMGYNAYLVTGNQKHYPVKDFIVTPSEMMEILDQYQQPKETATD